MNRKIKSVYGLFILGCTWTAPSFSADFFTIIGPDGRPIIIQEKEKKGNSTYETVAIDENKKAQHIADQVPQSKQQAIKTNSETTESEVKQVQNNTANVKIIDEAIARSDEPKQAVERIPSKVIVQNSNQQSNQAQKSLSNIIMSSNVKNLTESNIQVPTKKIETNNSQAKVPPKKDDSKFTKIDGVEYVDNEYLEDKEFNLEGKKRFYIMPDSSGAGGRSFQTVEREKGITKSVFSKFLKNTNNVQQPIVLASTYFRLPKEEVVQNLEQSCFAGKKMNKAKQLSANNDEIGFWPTAPIKENFAYEVVKLEPDVQNIHLSSYASSQKNPTYYWPLVVFLDHKGCVIEGVSGFKSEDLESNNTEYSALAGILKKPEKASYLFMTPLVESVDIKTQKLSNTGQIKLSILR